MVEGIAIEWISTNFRIARTSLTEILCKSIESVPQGQNLIVDIGGRLHFDAIDPEIHFGVADFIEQAAAAKFEKIIVICPGRLFPNSPEESAYDRITSHLNVAMVFLEGNELETEALEAQLGAAGVVAMKPEMQKISDIRKVFFDKLDRTLNDYKQTIIRKPGLFKGQQGGEKFPFTFDFSNGGESALKLCQKQIYILKDQGISLLFYAADRQWFANIVEDAISLSEIPMTALPLSMHEPIDSSLLDGRDYVVFCPVVRSGKQFSSLLGHANLFPKYLWSLGSIDEGKCVYVDENTRKLGISMSDASIVNLDLRYEIAIRSEVGRVPKIWRNLSVDIDQLRVSTSKHKISSSAAWAMMMEAGFGPESYGPDRPFLTSIPRFSELVDRNDGYLALIFREQISETINRPLSETDLILCVDEIAAKTLARKIVGTAYEKSICVSRDLLKAIKLANSKENSKIKEVLEEYDDEIERLKEKIRYAKDVNGYKDTRIIQTIVVDELIISGDTIETLGIIAKEIGLDVQLAISILKISEETVDAEFPVKSLYSIPVPNHAWKVS